jgi:hypothetical protein
VKAMLAPLHGTPTPSTAAMSAPQAAFDKVNAELPEMTGISIIFPGSPFGWPCYYLIWTKGTALTSRLFSPALMDARNGQFDRGRNCPGVSAHFRSRGRCISVTMAACR